MVKNLHIEPFNGGDKNQYNNKDCFKNVLYNFWTLLYYIFPKDIFITVEDNHQRTKAKVTLVSFNARQMH